MKKSKRVLVVDDDLDNLGAVALVLEAIGYQVTMADGVVRARDALAASYFVAVVSDGSMPDGTCLDVLATAEEHHTPVIVMSDGLAWPTLCSDAMRQGAKRFLQKPFDGDELLEAVAEVISHRESHASAV